MVHIITRILEFDAGHRVYQHESKCNHIHGHRYKVELSVTASSLDDLGRVIDFSVLKGVCGKWIDDNWDHGMILNCSDPLCDIWKSFGSKMMKEEGDHNTLIDKMFNCGKQKLFTMDGNPTAENMAGFLYNKFNDLLVGYGIVVTTIKLWETPNCFAIYAE